VREISPSDNLLDCIRNTDSAPVCERRRPQKRIDIRCDDVVHRTLDDAITNGRNLKKPLPAVRFGNSDLKQPPRSVRTCRQLLRKMCKSRVNVLGKTSDRIRTVVVRGFGDLRPRVPERVEARCASKKR